MCYMSLYILIDIIYLQHLSLKLALETHFANEGKPKHLNPNCFRFKYLISAWVRLLQMPKNKK